MALRTEAIPMVNHIIIPTLEEIIKSSSGRKKNFKLVLSACKSVQKSISKNITHPDSKLILNPFILACKSHEKKFAVPALNCFQKLISCDLLTSEADQNICSSSSMVFKVLEAICTVCTFMDDAIELLMVNTLLCAMTLTSLKIQGGCLLLIAKTSYDLHMKRKNVVSLNAATEPLNDTLLVMVYKRMEEDWSTVTVQPVFVPGSDSKNTSEFMKGYISKFTVDGASYKMIVEQRKRSTLLELIDEVKCWDISVYPVVDDDSVREVDIENIQRRCSLVYSTFCKLPVKMHPKDDSTEASTDFPKILLENAAAFPPTTDSENQEIMYIHYFAEGFVG